MKGLIAARAPQVIRLGGFDMQVCVPEEYTDDQVIALAEFANPCGTKAGWSIRKTGSPQLEDEPERNPCDDPTRELCVHITLDA